MRAKRAPKSPTTYVPKRAHRGTGVTRQQELDLRRMAGLIKDENHLNSIMLQVKPEMHERSLERIRPYLPFQVSKDFLSSVLKRPETGA